jgi:hypothetical protein
MRLLRLAPVALLAACASYHTTEVRVVSKTGGGIANASIEVTARSTTGDAGMVGKTHWLTDAAGRALLDRRDANSRHWRIRAEGYEPLTVDASPDEIRLKQADGKLPHADSVPLIFVLEPKNAASDPKKFESQAK